jgi:hypothetical protein
MHRHSFLRGLLLPGLVAVTLPLAAALGLPMVLSARDVRTVVVRAEVPAGSREVFVRGTMTGWSAERMEDPDGDGTYEISFDLAPGAYEYRISADGRDVVSDRALNRDGNRVLLVPVAPPQD